MASITRLLPRRLVSKIVGKIVHWQGPRWWARATIYNFAKYYNINFDEAEKPYTEYLSIGDFFVRKLKPEVRPLGAGLIVHPADSFISQFGQIKDGKLIQAKGNTYSVSEFIQDKGALDKYNDGFFATYYLCPTDYHRVHSPVSGKITFLKHIVGDLWPVNEWSVFNIKNLFVVNERVYVEISTAMGPVGVVFVGATNVGHIEVFFDSSIHGNARSENLEKKYEPSIDIQKGEPLGQFRMGSTVVLLFPKSYDLNNFSSIKNQNVKVNSAIG